MLAGRKEHFCCFMYCSLVAKLCPTLCNPVVTLQDASVYGIFQARILERVAISFSRRSSQPRDRTSVSCILCTGWQILYRCTAWEARVQTVSPGMCLSSRQTNNTQKAVLILLVRTFKKSKLIPTLSSFQKCNIFVSTQKNDYPNL